MRHLSEEEVMVEFERRRKKMLQGFGLAIIFLMLSLMAKQIMEYHPWVLGVGRNGWYALSIAQFAASVLFAIRAFLQYKCPACNENLRGHDSYYLGTLLNPSKCPHCGTRLQ